MARHKDGSSCPNGIRTEVRGSWVYAYCAQCGAFLGRTVR